MITFDRTLWQHEYISNLSRSAWRCSKCWSGNLQLNAPFEKTKRVYHNAKLICANNECKQIYYLTGNLKHYSYDGVEVGPQSYWAKDFRLYPTHFQPELKLFKFPMEVNDQICEILNLSFNHFWYDLDACANKIRQSLEIIVSDLDGTGKTLQTKITSLQGKIKEDLDNLLMALKWVGNEGSHLSLPFTRGQILDVYELLVDVLNILHPDNSNDERKKALIKKINKNRGIKKQ